MNTSPMESPTIMIANLPPLPLAAALLAVAALGADAPPRLATFDDVQAKLATPTLRLLDARPRADYDKGHIPGAVWLDAKAAETLAARPGGLTDREVWATWSAPLGIKEDSDVLIYDAKRQLDAARAWWLLGYLGVEQVGLVDGGFPLWASQGRPVSTEVVKVEPRPIAVKLRADRLATRPEVLDALKGKGARVVDARTEAEHIGTRAMSKRGGRVPTSCHVEWTTLVDADGKFLAPESLQAKLAAAGLKPGEPVISHCQGGGRASVDAFVLERLGFPTRNYYLGWSDWGNADDTPVATGTVAKP